MDEREIDWERLDRYVRGEGTADERAALERWVDADPELRGLAEAMRTVGRHPGDEPPQWNARAAWQRVERRMRWGERAPLQVVSSTSRHAHAGDERAPRRRWRAWLLSGLAGLAAAAVVGVAGVALWHRHAAPAPRLADVRPMREVATRRGQMATLDLRDGTRVVLAAESRLRIPTTFGTAPGASREVELEGEAFFDVRHDSTSAFRVHTPLGVAEDVGTQFAVNTYPETGGMRIAVASGSVRILRAASEGVARDADQRRAAGRPLLTLAPGDVARLDSTGTVTLTRDVDVKPLLAGARGALVLNGTPLGEAIPRLERWYDITIRTGDVALRARRVSGTFHDEPASAALGGIALSLDAKASWQGRVVTLSRVLR